MSFVTAMDARKSAMDARTTGENGSVEVSAKGLGSPLLGMFEKLVRGAPADVLKAGVAAIDKESAADLADLVVLAWQTRATRNIGKGEKELFYQFVEVLPVEAVLATVHLVPHFGYFKDWFELLAREGVDSTIKAKIVELVCETLKADEAALDAAETAKAAAVPAGAKVEPASLSLLAKWAPREGGAHDKKAKLASLIATAMFGGANKPAAQRKYRQLIAKLNAALGTTEVLMAANRWAEIKFAGVASLCLQRCRKAFLNERIKGSLTAAEEATGNRLPLDADRVAARANLRAAIASKAGVKGKQLGPHELAAKCMAGYRGLSTLESDLMDAQWASLKASVVESLAAAAAARDAAVAEAAAEGGLASVASLKAALPKHVDLGRLVPLVDVSGSMSGLPMQAAIGLGLLVAELTHPEFRDRCLTFESTPQWVDLGGCTSLAEKVGRVQGAEWGGSTDFAAACELILAAAERAKLKPDEIPDLIVFSDMQFDEAGGYGAYGYDGYGYGGGYGREARGASSWETHFERLSRRFAEVGVKVCGEPYAAPRIVFWNLRGDTHGYPVDKDAPNTQMLSGFSPALLKQVLTGADLVGDEVETEVVMPDGSVVKKVVREGPTPAETLRKVLDDEAFDPVRLALTKVEKGPLAAYTFERDGFDLVEAGGDGDGVVASEA